MKLIFNIFNRIELLPQFLCYYRKMGVDVFICGIWNGKNNPLWNEVNDASIIKVESFSGSFSGRRDSESQNLLRKKYVKPDEWFCCADLDEFYVIDDYNNFNDLTIAAEEESAELVWGRFVDRITSDGTIPENVENDIWEQFPLEIELTRNVANGCCEKVILSKGKIPINPGHHYFFEPDYKAFIKIGKVMHFKWWGKLVDYLYFRLNHYKKLGLPWYQESEKLIEYINQHNGRLV